jgi:hypothetical protein
LTAIIRWSHAVHFENKTVSWQQSILLCFKTPPWSFNQTLTKHSKTDIQPVIVPRVAGCPAAAKAQTTRLLVDKASFQQVSH